MVKPQMVNCQCHQSLPCNPSCQESQGYQEYQPGPSHRRTDTRMNKWFYYCHSSIRLKSALPSTQESQENLVLPTVATGTGRPRRELEERRVKVVSVGLEQWQKVGKDRKGKHQNEKHVTVGFLTVEWPDVLMWNFQNWTFIDRFTNGFIKTSTR